MLKVMSIERCTFFQHQYDDHTANKDWGCVINDLRKLCQLLNWSASKKKDNTRKISVLTAYSIPEKNLINRHAEDRTRHTSLTGGLVLCLWGSI